MICSPTLLGSNNSCKCHTLVTLEASKVLHTIIATCSCTLVEYLEINSAWLPNSLVRCLACRVPRKLSNLIYQHMLDYYSNIGNEHDTADL